MYILRFEIFFSFVLQGILKDKDQILSKWIDGHLSLDSKYLNPRNLVYGDIDNLVWQWYKKNNTEEQRITGNQIRDTALRLAKELGYDKFTARNGWLISWQKRHSIKSSSTHLQKTANRVLKLLWHAEFEFDFKVIFQRKTLILT